MYTFEDVGVKKPPMSNVYRLHYNNGTANI